MTDKQKQIEEMAKIVCKVYAFGCGISGNCDLDRDVTNCRVVAETAEKPYEVGYRKQSGWISVKERLPEQKVMVLGFCHTEGDDEGYNDRILVMELNRLGQFMPFNCSPIKDNSVTHWMPLPEPPKMKGGESDA